jgi:ribosomal protein S18 acetylase RimI-like enzyme
MGVGGRLPTYRMKIRLFKESDTEAVAAIWREVFPNNPPWNIPERDIEKKLEVQRELFFVAEIDTALVGTAMAGYDGHRGWVYYVTVRPEHQRKGIGEALMRHVETELKKLGCHKLNLQVRSSNKGVIEFYKKLGYNIEDRVSMGKLLE